MTLISTSEKLGLTATLAAARKTILCVPGTLLSPHIFDGFLCPPDYQCSAISWLAEDGPWDIDSVAMKISTLISHLNLKDVILIGHSAGGAICLSTALKTPVSGLVLSNTGANTARHGDPSYPQRILDSWGEELRRAQVRRCFVKTPTRETFALLDAYADCCPRDGTYAAASSLRSLDLLPRLHEIQCPALLAFGKFDVIRTTSDIDMLSSKLQASTIVQLDAGHTPMLEDREMWNQAVVDWISTTFP